MDRFTWGVVAGVIAICLIALGNAVFLRAGEKAPDLTTPEGVALAYAIAIQNQDPDRAWDLLASPDAAGFSSPFGAPPALPPPVTAAPPPQPTPGATGTAAATPTILPTPARPGITQEQFRQSVYNNPKRPPGRRLRVTGVAAIVPDRARVDMEVIMTTDGARFPWFGFGGPGSGYTVTFELQRRGSTWLITSAPPVFNFL